MPYSSLTHYSRIFTHPTISNRQHVLQRLLHRYVFILQTLCSLELFNTTRENVIIAGKLSEEIDYSMLSPVESLTKEKVKSLF